jgi:hypothetical protein
VDSLRFSFGQCRKTRGAISHQHHVKQPIAGIDQRIPYSIGIGAIVLDEENVLQRVIRWRPNPWAAPIEADGRSFDRTVPYIDNGPGAGVSPTPRLRHISLGAERFSLTSEYRGGVTRNVRSSN